MFCGWQRGALVWFGVEMVWNHFGHVLDEFTSVQFTDFICFEIQLNLAHQVFVDMAARNFQMNFAKVKIGGYANNI